jgi:lambda family phage portal protein
MTSNWLDKAIGFVNPQAELRRVAYRRQIEILSRYEGAKTGRRTAGWSTNGASANTELSADLPRLRNRSRELIRNDSNAASLQRKWSDRVVGYGITPRWADDRLAELWETWAKACSSDAGVAHFGALTWLAEAARFESGECLIRRRYRRLSDKLRVPMQLQVLEPDYLDTAKNGPTENGYAVQGIQFDQIGRRTGYWLHPVHPGETTIAWRQAQLASTLVPASDVIHLYFPTRPGQARGVPALAPIMLSVRDLDDWEDAELVRKKVEACLAAFITSPEGDAMALAAQTTDPETGQVVESFEPGMITRLKPGEQITINQPRYAGGYRDYKSSIQHDIAAPIMPYELMTGDFSQVNYSSYRGGLLAFRSAVEVAQWSILIPLLCERVAAWFLDAAELGRVLPSGVDTTVKWSPPPFDLLDRESEAKADQIELQLGKKTWPQLVSEQGEDPERQLAEIEAIAERLRGAGVDFFGGKAAMKEEGTNEPAQ